MSKRDWLSRLLGRRSGGAEPPPTDAEEQAEKGAAPLALRRAQEAVAGLLRVVEAADRYDHGLEIDSHDAADWKDKGLGLVMQARYEDALACFERGLEIDPSDAFLWDAKALVLRAMNRFEEALAACDRGLEVDRHSTQLWNNKGDALKALGRMEEAEACWRGAKELAGG
jgi:tetratricopeptide (TPR) repeat protein